jgi:hypothetical protein
MASVANTKVMQLPGQFPVGTRYIIEARGGRIDQRYLEFPDGQKIDLLAVQTGRAYSRNDRRLGSARRNAAGGKA